MTVNCEPGLSRTPHELQFDDMKTHSDVKSQLFHIKFWSRHETELLVVRMVRAKIPININILDFKNIWKMKRNYL